MFFTSTVEEELDEKDCVGGFFGGGYRKPGKSPLRWWSDLIAKQGP